MRKLSLLLIIMIFCLGSLVSTQASMDGDRDCARRCRHHFQEARQRCRHLDGEARERCLREAREHFEACVRGCRN